MFASAIAVLVAGSAATVAAVSAIPLAFVEPQTLAIADGAGSVRYKAGEQVNISWTSPFDYTTLTLWEGPFSDGSYQPSVLADKWSNDRTHLTWKASSITQDPRHGFHFELRKGFEPNECAACVANSPRFAVAAVPQHTTTSSATSSHMSTSTSHSRSSTTSSHPRPTTSHSSTSTAVSTTSSAISTTTATLSTSSTPTITASRSSTVTTGTGLGVADANALSTTSAAPSYLPDSTNSEHSLGVGLAVGFGAGVPIIIAAYAVILFFYTRRQRQTQSVRLPSLEDDAEQLHEKEPRSATNSWISKFSLATVASLASTYHEPFEFQEADGSKRPGSERLFRNGEQIPGVPGRVFRR